MSNLPANWARCNLGDLIEKIEAGLNVKCEERPPENGERGLLKISAVTWGRFNEMQSKTLPSDATPDISKKINKGDLLFSRANTLELVGASVIVHEIKKELYLSDKVLRLVISEGMKSWVNYALKTQAMRKAIGESSSGNQLSMRNISQDKLKALELPIAPLAEQRRIADKLDTTLARVDALNDRLARITPLLKRFRQSVLAAATSGRLTEDWRSERGDNLESISLIHKIQKEKLDWCGKNKDHNEANRVMKRLSRFRDNISFENFNGWVISKLEDAVLMIVDCHNKTAPYALSGYPLIRTSNIRDGEFIYDDLRFVEEETYFKWSRRNFPVSGDLIFTREAPMGEVAIIPADKKFCLGQRTMLIRPVEELVSAQFLKFSLMSPLFKQSMFDSAVGTGVKHLRVGDVSELPIAIPSAEEQTEIVRRVETLFAFADRLEARLQSAQTAAERLTPALLAKAFRGELVPQDPSDEPATELLRRLREARAAEAPAKPQRGRKAAATPKVEL